MALYSYQKCAEEVFCAFSIGGANFVRSIPSTAVLYSSIVGVLPNIAERTTTGADARSDSPFFSDGSYTTLPCNNLVDVASTVSTLAAFS